MPQTQTLPFLSVVFSFRNEEAVLPELIRRTRKAAAESKAENLIKGHELVFINDASNDNSLKILKQSSKEHNDIRIVTMSRAFGVSACIMAGFAHSKGDAVIYMDADLQDPPEIIPALIRKWRETSVDIVHTVRRKRLGESPFKMLLTKIGYLVLNRFSTVSLPQEAGDFKLLSRRAIDHLLTIKEPRPFIRGLVCWIGFQHSFLEYERSPRFAGKTKFPILGPAVLSNFFNSALLSSPGALLIFAPITGTLCFTAGLVTLLCFGLKESTNILLLIIGGLQLIGIGILGIYVNNISEQGKHRPLYIVESTEGFPAQD